MTNNLFADLPATISQEFFANLVQTSNMRIERIVSMGHTSPDGFWYDQDDHEWVVLLKGAARLQFDNRYIDLRPGDFINIPAHQKHRVAWTATHEPTIWLAVFYNEDDSHEAPCQ